MEPPTGVRPLPRQNGREGSVKVVDNAGRRGELRPKWGVKPDVSRAGGGPASSTCRLSSRRRVPRARSAPAGAPSSSPNLLDQSDRVEARANNGQRLVNGIASRHSRAWNSFDLPVRLLAFLNYICNFQPPYPQPLIQLPHRWRVPPRLHAGAGSPDFTHQPCRANSSCLQRPFTNNPRSFLDLAG